MSSLEIAELTGKRHDHVKRDVRKMLSGLEKDISSNLRTCLDSYDRSQEIFLLDHDLTMTLVSGYNVKLRHAVIVRLRELETGQATPWHEKEPEKPELPNTRLSASFWNIPCAAALWPGKVFQFNIL